MAVEVNLVLESLQQDIPNVINRVVPYVPVDMISYSSYDTQHVLQHFETALKYISVLHNRTPASPLGARALFLGEFGLAQSQMPLKDVKDIVGNIINSALTFGVAFVMFWEVYCNECRPPIEGCSNNGRCRDSRHPVRDTDRLNGFWLVRPDGSFSWPRDYIAAKISGAHLDTLLHMRLGDGEGITARASEPGIWHGWKETTAMEPMVSPDCLLLFMMGSFLACMGRDRWQRRYHARGPSIEERRTWSVGRTLVGAQHDDYHDI